MPNGEQGETILATEIVPEAPPPRRLGGWLILALVLLLAWPLHLLAALLPAWLSVRDHGLGPIWDQDPTWLLVATWNLLSGGALAGLSLWTLPRFWRKRRGARKLMIVFFAATFVVGVANYVINSVLAAPGAPPPSMWRVAISTAIAAAWISYFDKSDRVRETFVLP